MRLFCILFVMSLTACESAVDPYAGGAPPYTIWGIINSAADTQQVRVFRILGQPGIDRPGNPDAAVTSTNLTTGEQIRWEHRKVTYRDSATGHVYWAPFRATPGHRYQLDVTRSDGETTSATVTIPQPVHIELNTEIGRSDIPVEILGEAPSIVGAEVLYVAGNLPAGNPYPPERAVPPNVVRTVSVPYTDELIKTERGWHLDILMQRDFELVRNEFEVNCLVTEGNPDISLRRVELRLVAADSVWRPPNGWSFEPEVLVQPGAMSNVQNGLGFLGGGQAVSIRWTPPRDVRHFVGYRDERPCNFTSGPTPECVDVPIPCIGQDPGRFWDPYF